MPAAPEPKTELRCYEGDEGCDGDGRMDGVCAFNGATVWSDEIGPSWSHVGMANGVLYAATQDAAEFYAYDATTGERLAVFSLPEGTTSAGGPVVVDGTLYLPYGVDGNKGGVQAYRLR